MRRPSAAFRRSLVQFTLLNGGVLALWQLSRLVPPLAVLAGLPIAFFPGWLVAKTLERLAQQRERPVVLGLWTVVFGSTVVPAAVSVVVRHVPLPVFGQILPAWLLVWAICACAFIAVVAATAPPGEGPPAAARPDRRRTVAAVLAAVGIVAVNLVLYRFIPEADGYGYLIKLRAVAADPSVAALDPRGVFLVATGLWSQLTRLDPYWLFKAVLPLVGSVVTVVALSLETARVGLRPGLRFLALLLPFCLPVFVQELLVVRPQSLVVLALLPALALLPRLSERRGAVRMLYWTGGLAVAGAAGLGIHTLAAILVALAVIASLVVMGPWIRRHPADTVVLLLVAIVAGLQLPALARLAADTGSIAGQLGRTVAHGHFELWFLDRYRNVDGSEVGWPGWTALFYYGYNLGVALPLILGYLAWYRHPGGMAWQGNWPGWLLLLGFFLIAEVFPRFGYAFLPDRAWLFLGIGASFLLPSWLGALEPALSPAARRGLYTAVGLSLIAATAVTWAKQGWVSAAEYQAVPFVQQHTPANAQFLAQGSSRIAVRYFAGRIFLPGLSAVVTDGRPDAVERVLDDLAAADRATDAAAAARRSELQAAVAAALERYVAGSSGADRAAAAEDAERAVEQTRADERSLAAETAVRYDPAAPVYLLYDAGKFGSLYGQRAWWRLSNAYGADTAAFDARYPVVYREGQLTIWRVR